MLAVSLLKFGPSLAQVTGTCHNPYFFRGIKAMAQVGAEEVIAAETADVSDAVTRAVTHVQATAASSEAAAEATVGYGRLPSRLLA